MRSKCQKIIEKVWIIVFYLILFYGLQRCNPIIGDRHPLARVDHKNSIGTTLREHVLQQRIKMCTFISEHKEAIEHILGKSKMHSLADDLSRATNLMSPLRLC